MSSIKYFCQCKMWTKSLSINCSMKRPRCIYLWMPVFHGDGVILTLNKRFKLCRVFTTAVRSLSIYVRERPRTFGNNINWTDRSSRAFANSRKRTREVVRLANKDGGRVNNKLDIFFIFTDFMFKYQSETNLRVWYEECLWIVQMTTDFRQNNIILLLNQRFYSNVQKLCELKLLFLSIASSSRKIVK